jgi:hypothetical protein
MMQMMGSGRTNITMNTPVMPLTPTKMPQPHSQDNDDAKNTTTINNTLSY